jgi:hypothetical protein
MPFNVNNVDITVAANTIYGLTNGIIAGLLPMSVLDDPDIQVKILFRFIPRVCESLH